MKFQRDLNLKIKANECDVVCMSAPLRESELF